MIQFTDEFIELLRNYVGPNIPGVNYYTNGIKGEIGASGILRSLDKINKSLLIDALKCVDYNFNDESSFLGSKIKLMLNNCFPGCTFEFNNHGGCLGIDMQVSLLERVPYTKANLIDL
jgi:hypothetical protein